MTQRFYETALIDGDHQEVEWDFEIEWDGEDYYVEQRWWNEKDFTPEQNAQIADYLKKYHKHLDEIAVEEYREQISWKY